MPIRATSKSSARCRSTAPARSTAQRRRRCCARPMNRAARLKYRSVMPSPNQSVPHVGQNLVPRIDTFALHPSSPELFTCAKWRVEAFADVLGKNVEREEKSLEAFTSDQTE